MENKAFDYREVARRRHEKYLKEKELKDQEENKRIEQERLVKQKELDRINEIKRLEELKIQEELSNICTIMAFIDSICDMVFDINNENDSDFEIVFNINRIYSIIEENLDIIIKHDKNSELVDKIINLTNNINIIRENKKNTDTQSLNNIAESMQKVYEICGLEIQIELMDTSNDEEYAKKLANTLNPKIFKNSAKNTVISDHKEFHDYFDDSE